MIVEYYFWGVREMNDPKWVELLFASEKHLALCSLLGKEPDNDIALPVERATVKFIPPKGTKIRVHEKAPFIPTKVEAYINGEWKTMWESDQQ